MNGSVNARGSMGTALRPLVVDVAVPRAIDYILHAGLLSPGTMAWLSEALLAGGIVFAMIASGVGASSKLEQLVDAEAAA